MSEENLKQFMSKVADSEELQAKIGEEIDAEALIALGAECGCEFTAEELQDNVEHFFDTRTTLGNCRKSYSNEIKLNIFVRRTIMIHKCLKSREENLISEICS